MEEKDISDMLSGYSEKKKEFIKIKKKEKVITLIHLMSASVKWKTLQIFNIFICTLLLL